MILTINMLHNFSQSRVSHSHFLRKKNIFISNIFNHSIHDLRNKVYFQNIILSIKDLCLFFI